MIGWVYDTITAIGERKFLGAIREELLSPLEGEIVEIGAGTGASFPYYKPSTHVLAIEPDPSMLARAKKRAKSARARIESLQADDNVLDYFPAQSVDHVVATLVLCSVENPLRTLQRVQRILKPSASFVTIEHVGAENGVARLQGWLTPFWRRIAGNCHLNRVLEPALKEAGFLQIRLRSRKVPIPMRRLLYGFATKGES